MYEGLAGSLRQIISKRTTVDYTIYSAPHLKTGLKHTYTIKYADY